MRYYMTGSNGNGHGTHSPFVFNFIKRVLTDKEKYSCYSGIENLRAVLKRDTSSIKVEDFGAGSGIIKSDDRIIKAIACSSLKPKKYAQLLYRMVQYYQPQTVLELGTSFGLTTAYLACGNTRAKVYTCEGSPNIAMIAKRNFTTLNISNVTVLQGAFDQTFAPLLTALPTIDFAFIDGNHRKKPTLQYFEMLLAHANNSTIMVFDDIHWSAEMETAWTTIQHHPAVTLTIDLFFIGIVFINRDIKVKQHFTIAY